MFCRLQNLPHWEKLRNSVLMTDLIVDKLVFKDVQLTATNDDQYFVFEDILYQVYFGIIILNHYMESFKRRNSMGAIHLFLDYALFFP